MGRIVGWLTAFAAVCALYGCGGSGSGTGTLRVVMVDAPDPLVESINVTISRVEAHVGSQWLTLTDVPQDFSLMDLVTNEGILASAQLPVGRYTQIRLFPSDATVTDSTGTYPVDIPSAVRTGVKLNVDYEIGPNQVTTILLDFNVAKSLIRRGNGDYLLQPVIPCVVKVLSGVIGGKVTASDGATPVQGAAVKAVYESGGKYSVGTEVNVATTLADGTFRLWALLPGTYTVSATYNDGSKELTAEKTGVVVTADHLTDIGTLALN